MQSHLQDIARPATATLLKAIDETMNGNTFLLKVQTDTPLTTSTYRDELSLFLRSPLFQEMIIELDQQRELYNYTWWAPNADDQIEMEHPAGTLVKDQFELICTPMDERQFADRLHWMLREAFSPYHAHKTEEQAQELIRDFFWEVFGLESWPLDEPSACIYWKMHSWSFVAIKPDFLYGTGYYDNVAIDDIPPFTYFDGGSSDSCTFFYEADIFSLFFTNGSPSSVHPLHFPSEFPLIAFCLLYQRHRDSSCLWGVLDGDSASTQLMGIKPSCHPHDRFL